MMKREVLNYNGIQYLKYSPTTMQVKGSVLFLHGIGERGTDITLVEHNEIPKQCLDPNFEVSYIVIAPQLPLNFGGWWESYTNPLVSLMKTQSGHKHLTGISLGGMRIEVILVENPGVFDSASSICGKNDVPIMGQKYVDILTAELTRMPTIHYYDPADKTIQNGDGSGYVSIKAMCDQFAGKADITFVELSNPSNHHAIWPIAYQSGNFWKWLDSKVSPPPAPVPDPVVSMSLVNGILVLTTQSGKTVNVTPLSITQ